MAAITSANVQVLETTDVISKALKSFGVRRKLAITLAAQGGTAGDIPASALGLKQITSTRTYAAYIGSAWVGNAPTFIGNSTSTLLQDGNYIFPVDLTQATDASRANPANITGVLDVEVEGIPN